MKRVRKSSGIFRRYFLSSFTIILASFIVLGTALALVVPSVWMKERLNSLEEIARSVTQNTENVLDSNYYGKANKNAVMMICNNLSQISNATEADVFIINENGEVVYCKDAMDPNNKGECFVHDQYQIPSSVLEIISDGEKYKTIGTMDGMLAANNLIVAIPLMLNDEFRGAVVATQGVSNGLWVYVAVIARMFFIATLLALFFTLILSYFVSYRLTKPLREMSAASKQYALGNFSSRIKIKEKKHRRVGNDEINELAMSFNSMAAAIEAQEESRRTFVSNVSHELKTPMTSIGGFIDGILDGTIGEEDEKKYLKIVSDEVKRLSRLVTGMLNMSKIEEGKLQVNRTEFDLSDMLFRTLLSFEQIIESKNIEIKGLENISENKVNADKDMINQVIYNLVDNAVKFTPEGGCIEVSSERENGKAIMKVRNTGDGIAPSEIGKIFDRFYKIDKSRSYDVKGAGMGLFIVKQLIELHGGKITATSTEHEYAEFIFDLPL